MRKIGIFNKMIRIRNIMINFDSVQQKTGHWFGGEGRYISEQMMNPIHIDNNKSSFNCDSIAKMKRIWWWMDIITEWSRLWSRIWTISRQTINCCWSCRNQPKRLLHWNVCPAMFDVIAESTDYYTMMISVVCVYNLCRHAYSEKYKCKCTTLWHSMQYWMVNLVGLTLCGEQQFLAGLYRVNLVIQWGVQKIWRMFWPFYDNYNGDIILQANIHVQCCDVILLINSVKNTLILFEQKWKELYCYNIHTQLKMWLLVH